ncbi:MAG: ComEC family competence protein [Gammaproteobacteria bacterium]|nr:ComEC family competence protein [Gammaproteobacteria bacterium]
MGHAYLKLYPALDKSLEGIDLEVTGQIVSIPSIQARSTRFDFLIHEASRTNGSELIIVPKKVRLNWYGKVPELQLGESWQLRVRLKRPWGFANPGSFDYEKWLFEHEIRATGYVRGKGVAKRLDVTGFRQPSHFIRAWLNQQLQQASSGKNTSVIKALALGEKSDMSPQRWKVLTETGTNHLLAISGLHVGLVSGFIYFLLLQVWKLSEALCLRIAAQRVAAIGAIFAKCLICLARRLLDTHTAGYAYGNRRIYGGIFL